MTTDEGEEDPVTSAISVAAIEEDFEIDRALQDEIVAIVTCEVNTSSLIFY